MTRVQIWFDGGCQPNPGKGYGSYEIRIPCTQHVPLVGIREKVLRMKYEGLQTNNTSEYLSMIMALESLIRHVGSDWAKINSFLSASGLTVDIFSDSLLLVKQMTGQWRSKNPEITELRDRAMAVLKNFGHWNVKWQGRDNNVERFGH